MTKSYFTRAECLHGRDKEYPLSKELENNLAKLMVAINKLRYIYGKPMVISSCYRPGHYNKAAGGAKNSAHLTCEAVDFADKDGKIKDFITLKMLEDCGLYMEAPHATPTWCHLQIRPTKNRVFTP